MTRYGRAAVEHARVHDAGDVLARDARRRLALAEEARDRAGHLARDGQQELERDALIELRVARRDDDPHAAGAEHALDLELAGEDLARLHRRRARARRRRSRPAAPIGVVGRHRGSTRPRRSGPGGRSSRSSGSTATPAHAGRACSGAPPVPSSDGSTNDERATAETSCRHSSHVLMCSSARARGGVERGLGLRRAFASSRGHRRTRGSSLRRGTPCRLCRVRYSGGVGTARPLSAAFLAQRAANAADPPGPERPDLEEALAAAAARARAAWKTSTPATSASPRSSAAACPPSELETARVGDSGPRAPAAPATGAPSPRSRPAISPTSTRRSARWDCRPTASAR